MGRSSRTAIPILSWGCRVPPSRALGVDRKFVSYLYMSLDNRRETKQKTCGLTCEYSHRFPEVRPPKIDRVDRAIVFHEGRNSGSQIKLLIVNTINAIRAFFSQRTGTVSHFWASLFQVFSSSDVGKVSICESTLAGSFQNRCAFKFMSNGQFDYLILPPPPPPPPVHAGICTRIQELRLCGKNVRIFKIVRSVLHSKKVWSVY